ncbi:MAG TPA: YcgL domain-containing protein [Solimonas sp.]
MTVDCIVYRCSKQDEMYLYLRADLNTDHLPEPLRQRSGRLSEVMRLTLSPQRTLARVDVGRVMAGLQRDGWYLQMPPDGHIRAYLNDAD